MFRIVLCLLWILPVLSVFAQAPDAIYDQEIPMHLNGTESSLGGNFQAQIDEADRIWLLSPDGILFNQSVNSTEPPQKSPFSYRENSRIAIFPPGHGIVIVDAGRIGISQSENAPKFTEFDFGPVSSVVATPSGVIWIGSGKGLFRITTAQNAVERIPDVHGHITALAINSSGELAVGTQEQLYRIGENSRRHEFIPGLIDSPITALVYDHEGNLWIGTRLSLNVQRTDKTFDRYTGLQGLPYNDIACLAASPHGDIWIGTTKGAIRLHQGEWSYYFGPRWIKGEKVSSIAVDKNGNALICADGGLSEIRLETWSLAQKEKHYSEMTYPRFDRHGFVSDVHLAEMGNPEKYVQHDNDNDGLWTAMYLASLCFEYSVTKDESVREKAWRHFAAMEKLESITGVPGFFARSYVTKEEGHGGGGEWHPSADGQWIWKGDTSSDELVGHMFVYPLMYELVARTDEEKERVRGLVTRIMDYVVDNGYYLLDLDGKPTMWGVWAPEKLNLDSEWTVERGLNSLQMLSFLVSAHFVTGSQKYLDAFHNLIQEHGYLENMINQKIVLPSEVNHSDDELAFLPYYCLFRYTQDTKLKKQFQLSIERAWKIEQPEKSSLWNIIYGSTGVPEFGLNDAVWTLQQWPLDLIGWPMQNSHRKDLFFTPEPGRHGESQSVTSLPPDEHPLMRWNGNPYTLNGGGGHDMHDPGAWLLPYWMGRYHGFIE